MKREQRVVVGISGGVDSAVTALLLKEQGYEVVGVFMKNWEDDGEDLHCPAAEDHAAAQAVCAHLEIPLQGINFSAQYRERVFQSFLTEFRAGRTPNPDVLCNREIKFKTFLEHGLSLGAARIATGHYAGISERGGRYRLLTAADRNKDQTYFLHMLGQKELSRALFPLAGVTKPEVRALACRAGLPNHDRKDSTGICFIGERNFKSFLARYLPAQPGEMRALGGERMGQHDGLMYHTIGQRHGLGIGGAGEPWYVVAKDVATNTLYVEQGVDHPALYGRGLEAEDLHWVDGHAPTEALSCTAKIRYRQRDQACRVTPLPDGRVRVEFREPQRAITPGQSVVFYQADECLGGGVIRYALQPAAPAPALSATSA